MFDNQIEIKLSQDKNNTNKLNVIREGKNVFFPFS